MATQTQDPEQEQNDQPTLSDREAQQMQSWYDMPSAEKKPGKSESSTVLSDKEKSGSGNFSYNPGSGEPAKKTDGTSTTAPGNTIGAGNISAGKIYSKVLGNKKKKGGVGGALAAIVLLFFLFFLQGPFQVIQFAQMLERFHFSSDENFMDGRTGKLVKWARTRGNEQNRNLDYFGNKFADHFEKKLKKNGMTPEYNKAGRISAIIIDPDTPAGKKTIQTLHEQGMSFEATSTDVTLDKTTGKYKVDVSGTSAKFRRNAVATMVKSLGMGHAATNVSTRLLRVRAGVGFHPLKNIARAGDEKLLAYKQKVQKERADRIRNGVPAPTKATAADGTDEKGNTVPADEDTAGGASGVNDAADGVDGQTAAEKKAADLKGKLKTKAGALTLITTLCGIKAVSNAIGDIRYLNIVLPLIRTGMDIVTTGSQVQAGEGTNLDEVGVISDQFYDEKTNTSWDQAKSIQAEMGDKQTGPDIPDSAKPGKDKPAFFVAVDNVINTLRLNTACKAVTSKVGGWLVTGLGAAIGVAGPLGFLLNVGTDVIAGYALQPFITDIIKWIAGQQVPTDVAGATLGNFANYGTRLAANDVAITHGGTAMSNTVAQELKNENNQQLAVEFSHKPLLTRVFDRTDPDSAVSKVIIDNHIPSNGQPLLASVAKLPSIFSHAVSSFGSVLHPKAFAAATPYDYGFPAFGYTPDEVDNPEFDDPYANADIVEPNLAALNAAYGKDCFGLTIDPTTFDINTESAAKRYDQIPDKCNSKTDINLMRYRFYLADMSAAKAISCYESIDEDSCDELGMTTPDAAAGGGPVDCTASGVGKDFSAGTPTNFASIIIAAAPGRTCPGSPTPSGAVPNDPTKMYFASCSDGCIDQGQSTCGAGRTCVRVKYRNPPLGGNSILVYTDGKGGSPGAGGPTTPAGPTKPTGPSIPGCTLNNSGRSWPSFGTMFLPKPIFGAVLC